MFRQFVNAEGFAELKVISLLFFLTFFVGIVVWAFLLKRPFVSHMKNLPFEEANNHSRSKDNG